MVERRDVVVAAGALERRLQNGDSAGDAARGPSTG
jgi:hypothetical protein